MDGVLAANLGKMGYFAPPTVFEGKEGFLVCFSFKGTPENPNPEGDFDASKLIRDFGKKWEMADNRSSCNACCRFTNKFCDCAIDIKNQGATSRRSNRSTPSATSSRTRSWPGLSTSSAIR
jgi:2-methylcitrate dehydratase PrpD